MVQELRGQEQRLQSSAKDAEKTAAALEARSQQIRADFASLSEQLKEVGDGERENRRNARKGRSCRRSCAERRRVGRARGATCSAASAWSG